MPLASLTLMTADTGRTANEGYTSGSQSMQESGTAIRHAAAQVRAILMAQAAQQLAVPAETLRTEGGAVLANDGRRLRYGELVAGEILHVQAQAISPLRDARSFKVMGKPIERVDIPGQGDGRRGLYPRSAAAGNGACARRPSAELRRAAAYRSIPLSSERMSGVLKIVRDGNFLAVVSEREFQAVKAMRALAAAAKWEEKPQPAEAGEPSCHADAAAVRGHGDRRCAQARAPQHRRRWKRPTPAPIRRTPPSAPPAQSPNSTTARSRSGRTPRASTPTGRRLRKCCACPPSRFAASMSKARAAMATTAPTMPQRMRR